MLVVLVEVRKWLIVSSWLGLCVCRMRKSNMSFVAVLAGFGRSLGVIGGFGRCGGSPDVWRRLLFSR